MPKGKVKTQKVNKAIFMDVVQRQGSSIRKLGNDEDIKCSDKTIRRALNEGRMRPDYIDQIARKLNVDPEILTGKYAEISLLRRHIKVILRHLDEYPYFKQVERNRDYNWFGKLVESILSSFCISYEDQFVPMDLQKQYDFQKELFEAIMNVLFKHFDRDAYGDKKKWNCYRILVDLDSWYEDELGIPEAYAKAVIDIDDEDDPLDEEYKDYESVPYH